MKAFRIDRPRSVEQVEVPPPHLARPDRGRIVVRTAFVSICGSDVPFFAGTRPEIVYPLPAGSHAHECMGQVVESTSTRVHQGDWVVALPDNDLGLAEFYLADETRAVVLPDGPGLGEACLVQPLATVLYAVDRLEPVASRSVAVVGLGSMGLLFCWLLRRRGAGRILGIDPRPDRCKVALRLGADQAEAVTSAEVVLAARQNPPAWNAPQVCIEAVGHQLETLNDCIDLVHDQGTVVAFGVPDQPVYPLAFETFFRKNAGLVACVTPPWDRYLGDALELFISSRRELEVLFTHRFPMRNAAEAFAAYERRDPGLIKVLLEAPQW